MRPDKHRYARDGWEADVKPGVMVAVACSLPLSEVKTISLSSTISASMLATSSLSAPVQMDFTPVTEALDHAPTLVRYMFHAALRIELTMKGLEAQKIKGVRSSGRAR